MVHGVELLMTEAKHSGSAPSQAPAEGEGETTAPSLGETQPLTLQQLVWVSSSEQQPAIPGKYVVVSPMTPSPCMLLFEGTLNRHWEAVTQWYGPLPEPPG